MRNKKNVKLGQLQEQILKASLPVNADLRNEFKSITFETDEKKKFTLHEVILGAAAKISIIFLK